MRTKIVYSIISDSSDIFLEQLLVSVYSLRMHNPQAYVTVVMDGNTKESLIGGRDEYTKYVDETMVVDVPAEYSKKMRSRYIKTRLRRFITGDYLFIDSDTVITCSLESIDEIIKSDADVFMVLDEHKKYSKANSPYRDKLRMIGWDHAYKSNQPYYNSGVIIIKDNGTAREFSDSWYNNWRFETSKGLVFDQPALFYTLATNDSIKVCELSGEWNCQINRDCSRFISDSKIIHYFNSRNKVLNGYPSIKYFLHGEQPFIAIKENGGKITDEIMFYLSHPRLAFQFQNVNDVRSYIRERDSNIHSLFLSKPRLWRILENEAKYLRRFGIIFRKFTNKKA